MYLRIGTKSRMNTLALKAEVQIYKVLLEKLSKSLSEPDDRTLTDTLEGITNLHEMIAAVIRSALLDEALKEGLRTRLEEMRQRLSRLEERSARKRQLALEAMCEVGLKKLEQPDFTASARAGLPSLVVVSEDQIPADYWVPQRPKLDRQSLLAALKRGRDVPGAQLEDSKPTLAVRTK
jgi:Siphovirus Gp157